MGYASGMYKAEIIADFEKDVKTLRWMGAAIRTIQRCEQFWLGEAADIFGCTMGRIRQLALAGDLKCHHLHGRALVYFKDEVEEKAKNLPSTGRPRKGRKSA